jgi:hypothetical protein
MTYLLFSLPFTAWVLTAFFRELPTEIFQSAQVDGATPFQTFYMIMLPLTAPALVTTGLLAFIGAWNEYLFALTFTSIAAGRAHTAGDHRQLPVAVLDADSLWRDHGRGHHLQHPADRHGLRLPAPHRRRSHGRCGQGIIRVLDGTATPGVASPDVTRRHVLTRANRLWLHRAGVYSFVRRRIVPDQSSP